MNYNKKMYIIIIIIIILIHKLINICKIYK